MSREKFKSMDRFDVEAAIIAARLTDAERDAIDPPDREAFQVY